MKTMIASILLTTIAACGHPSNSEGEANGGRVVVQQTEQSQGLGLTFPVPVPVEPPPVIIVVGGDDEPEIDLGDCRDDEERARKTWRKAKRHRDDRRDHGGHGLKVCWDGGFYYRWDREEREWTKQPAMLCIGDN